MESIKKPLSIKVIYWITNISFWIYLAAAVFIIFLAAYIFLIGIDTLQLHVGLPIMANLNEVGSFDSFLVPNTVDVEMVAMSGKVHFVDTPVELARLYAAFMFIVSILFSYIFVIIRKFVNNVYIGDYFDIKNINLLKRISYGLIFLWLFAVSYGYFQYFFIAVNLDFSTIEFNFDVNTYPSILIVALIIWVLSHIFSKGVQLQEENKLTV